MLKKLSKWALISLLVLPLPYAYAEGNNDLEEFRSKLTNEWLLVKNDRLRKIKTYARLEDGKRYRSFKIEATLETDVESLARVLLDFDNYTRWFWKTRESKLIRQNSPTDYVLSPGYKRVIAGGQGEIVYVRGKDIPLGETFGLYRKGIRYDDPDTKEYLGFEGEDVANGRITAVQDDIATFEIARNTQEVRINDRMFATEARAVTPIFYPSNPVGVKNGRIIRIMGSLGNGGLNSVIVLNRGERDGVKQGHTFALYQRGAVVSDRVKEELVRLPSERAGLAMVFRTFNKVSYAIILRAATTIKVGDEVRPPISGD